MISNAIESLAINAVKDSIVVTDYLDQFLNENDKEPSWDGFIYIYNNKDKKKEHLAGRMPVQVKGKEYKGKITSKIKYPVNVSDLNNYLTDGGVVFFVVYILDGGNSKVIYYADMPPIKLRMNLKGIKNQKTKSIELKRFPSSNDSKCEIFFNCLKNCGMQKSFSQAQLPTLEQLEANGQLESLTIPVTYLGEKDPIEYLLSNSAYMYAKIKGCAIPQPLEMELSDMTVSKEVNEEVKSNGRVFYDSFVYTRKEGSMRFEFGESLSIVYSHQKMDVTYKSSKHLRTCITDLDFLLSIIKNRSMRIGDIELPILLDEESENHIEIDIETERLAFYKKTAEVFDILNCHENVDLTRFTPDDWRKVSMLVRAFVDKKQVYNKNDDLPVVADICIGGYQFLLVCIHSKSEHNMYTLSDFGNTNLPLLHIDEKTKEKTSVSQYCFLKCDDFIHYRNIRLEALLPSFKQYLSSEGITRANWTLLELILAYDKCKTEKYYKTAFELAEWLYGLSDEFLDRPIKLLNYLQVIRRARSLNEEEILQLTDLLESTDSDDYKVGAYLLLNNIPAAKKHLNLFDEKQREDFLTYPISHFFKADA